MIKAYIKYTDCMEDCKIVHSILAQNNICIRGEKESSWSIKPTITIIVDNQKELSDLLLILNTETTYGVKVVKTKEFGKGIFYYLLH